MAQQLKLTQYLNVRRAMATPRTQDIPALIVGYSSSNNSSSSDGESQIQTPPRRLTTASASRKHRPVTEDWIVRQLAGIPWLRYGADDDKLFCKICEKDTRNTSSYVIGIERRNWKEDSLKAHANSKRHIDFVAQQRARENPQNTPLGRAERHLRAAKMANMRVLFNTAAYVARFDKPFTDFRDLCKLQKRNGVHLDDQYINDQQCRTFIGYIAKGLSSTLWKRLTDSPWFSIMLDSSADLSNQENCNFFVRFIEKDLMVARTVFLGVENMHQFGDAEAYHNALKKIIERKNIENHSERMVGLGTDGASVNMGRHNGLGVRVQNEIPDITVVHCVAHNLQLALGDVVKAVVYIRDVFQPNIIQLVKFYAASPRRSEQLKEITKLLQNDKKKHFLKIPGFNGVRWVASEVNTLTAIIRDWKGIVTHLEELQVRDRPTAAEGAQAKGMLRHLKNVRFVKLIHFMADILSEVKILSLYFQEDDMYITDIPAQIEKVKVTLNALKHADRAGGFMTKFANAYDADARSFQGVKLEGNAMGDGAFDTDRNRIITLSTEYLSTRFETLLKSTVVDSSFVFDPLNWPDDSDAFVTNYGETEISKLAKHYGRRLGKGDDESDSDAETTRQDMIHTEWKLFKRRVAKLFGNPRYKICSFLACAQRIIGNKARFPLLSQLVQIVMALPCNTASCERGFSALNRIKRKERCALSENALEDCLTCQLLLPTNLDSYDIGNAIEVWYCDCKQSRRPNYKRAAHRKDEKKLKKKPRRDPLSLPILTTEYESSSESSPHQSESDGSQGHRALHHSASEDSDDS